MMKKFKILLLILISMLLISCGGNNNKMSEKDFKKYDELAKTAITYMNEKKTDEFIELTDKSGLTEKEMEEVYKLLSEYGEFKEFGNSEGIYLEDPNTKETYNTILQKVKYDNKELLFTVNFNQEDELAGIFFK